MGNGLPPISQQPEHRAPLSRLLAQRSCCLR